MNITIKYADGSLHDYAVPASLMKAFNGDAKGDGRAIAGMMPRVQIAGIRSKSPAIAAGLKSGDVIVQVAVVQTGEAKKPPTCDDFLEYSSKAGAAGNKLRLTVERDGKVLDPIEVEPTFPIARGKRGLGVVPDTDLGTPVIAGVVPGSFAANAGLKAGETVTAVND
ncbi:MAG: PDZ domain-containing protein [Tepidisphaeraceae bacterium]